MVKWLDPKKRINGKSYLVYGVIFSAIKFAVDRAILSSYEPHAGWGGLYMYTSPTLFTGLLNDPGRYPTFLLLCVLTLLCVFVGTILTVQRLRDAGLPLWLVLLFFIPGINILFFVSISALPSSKNTERTTFLSSVKAIPESKFGSGVSGVISSAFISLILAYLSSDMLKSYGLGLFVGIPFLCGLVSTAVFTAKNHRDFHDCLGVACISVTVLGGLFLAFALEGVFCLVMAAPFGYGLAAIGATLGYFCQKHGGQERPAVLSLATLPILIFVESLYPAVPDRYAVSTDLVINAPIETVWKNVVEFSELPAPDEFIFKSGISYPVRARIDGRGVGAIRYCEFSTGPFVEPITVWNEPTHLKFRVTRTPPPMQEWSPYANIQPAHISGFFESKEGQFVLEKVSENETKLIGTTWFEHKIFPQSYWNLWSRPILHTIHRRVLKHIRNLSEMDRRLTSRHF